MEWIQAQISIFFTRGGSPIVADARKFFSRVSDEGFEQARVTHPSKPKPRFRLDGIKVASMVGMDRCAVCPAGQCSGGNGTRFLEEGFTFFELRLQAIQQ